MPEISLPLNRDNCDYKLLAAKRLLQLFIVHPEHLIHIFYRQLMNCLLICSLRLSLQHILKGVLEDQLAPVKLKYMNYYDDISFAFA